VKTLTTYTGSDAIVKANLLKTRLEAEGIDVLIADQFTVSITPQIGGPMGGVRVQIREEDALKVKKLVDEDNTLKRLMFGNDIDISETKVVYEESFFKRNFFVIFMISFAVLAYLVLNFFI